MILLAILFFITALLYATVGFGGGSTYNALLVLNGVDYRILPAIALSCNIIVVTGGVFRFGLAGHIKLSRIAPWIATSIPAAWIGGRIPVSEKLFIGLLGLSLAFAGLRMLFQEGKSSSTGKARNPIWLAASGGAGLGLLSGVVGIGGGIFLAPILHVIRWGEAKAIAGACSLFILVNSVSGLAGQIAKLGNIELLGSLGGYWPLFPAVLIGGQIGSWLGSGRLSEIWVRRMTAVLILYVAARLLIRWLQLYA